MATRIAEYITHKLLGLSVIEEGDRELYVYGFFLLIMHSFFLLITIFAGLIGLIPGESFLFYMVFMTLRTYAGGVHAKTETTCTTLTAMALTGSVYGIKIMELANSKLISMLMLVLGSFCIFMFSPLDTKDKPLTLQEKRQYGMICHVLLTLYVVISITAHKFEFSSVYNSIACGVFLEGILLSIGKFDIFKKKSIG